MPVSRPFAILLGACFSFVCLAQLSQSLPQTENSKKYTVSGSVTNAATSEPIRRALVHLNGPVQLSAFTGPDGRFEFTGIPEGQIFVTAERPGFFDQQSLNQGVNTTVAVGPATKPLQILLTPEARIRGRVLDADGEPVEGLQLQLIAQEIQEGRKQLQPRASANTDENGTYEMEGLTPGQYFLRTMIHPGFSSSSMAPATAYPPEYYPNSADLASAQALELRPGEQAQADLTVHAAPAATIRGILSGAPQNGVFVTYEGADGQQIGESYVQFDPQTGKFAFKMVPYGAWTFHFLSRNGEEGMRSAEEAIDVNRPEISGLQVVLQPVSPIPVIVNRAPAPAITSASTVAVPNQGPGVQVQLFSRASNGERYFAGQRQGDNSGAIFVQGVRPGKYKVVAQAFGPECIESVSSGSVDLARNDLLVSSGSQPQPITVSLRNDCATLTGTVRSEAQNVQAFVVLLADSAATDPQLFPLQSNQQFTFSNLSPGTYRVWAFSNVAGLEYANPEALREYAGQQIELAPGQTASANLELVIRGNR